MINEFIDEYCSYLTDRIQRSILFMDSLRKEGNQFLEDVEQRQPPKIVFSYEVIIDGRNFERPVNYLMARLIDKRKGIDQKIDPNKRPVVIISPRSGGGPGIEGHSQDSQMGNFMSKGQPIYYIYYLPEVSIYQTYYDVHKAIISFLEEVINRHPHAPKPVVLGNCQSGYSSAIVAADRPDLVGPLMLIGSPLSFWSGVGGENPLRYRAGLCGGVWVNSALSDIGNGIYDGANLIANYRNLDPAEFYWKNYYDLFENIDNIQNEKSKRLKGSFCLFNDQEIHFITSKFFIGNELSRGVFKFNNENTIDLKNIISPVIVLASKGDNIATPQQALNWISKVYTSTEEIKRRRQVIVYIVHRDIGHLGLFLAVSIAQKKIIGNVEMIEFLSPGLYEMVIVEYPSKPWLNDYKVKFEPRTIDDILAYDDGDEDEDAFKQVAVISELNDKFYQAFLRPFIQRFVTKMSADIMRHLHPLRRQMYMFSDLNPLIIPVKTAAPYIRENRHAVNEDNVFTEIERMFSRFVVDSFDLYKNAMDLAQEQMFTSIYKNPMLKLLFPDAVDLENTPEKIRKDLKRHEGVVKRDKELLMNSLEEGGFTEGVIRMMIAMAGADGQIEDAKYRVATKIVKGQKRLRNISPEDLKTITRNQARILQTSYDKAIDALPVLIKSRKDRERALIFAQDIAFAEEILDDKQRSLLERLQCLFYQKN